MDAFHAGASLRLANPISACYAVGDVTLPKIRYICNPELPALQGTTKVAAWRKRSRKIQRAAPATARLFLAMKPQKLIEISAAGCIAC